MGKTRACMHAPKEMNDQIPFLLPHLLKRIRQIPTPNLLTILKLEKLIAPMPGHIHQHITPRIAPQSLPPWHILPKTIRQQTNEILHRDLVPAIIHLDVIAVEIQRAIRIVVDCTGEGVARIAGHVVRQHEDDLRVGNSKPFDGSVQREDVGKVAVVEPETRGGDQDGPVGGVQRGGEEGKEEERVEEVEEVEGQEFHCEL